MKLKALGVALLLGCASLSQAQEAPKPSPFTFQLKGFVSMSACYQEGAFGLSQCQQSLYAAPEPAEDKNSLSFDVRQSRFNFSVTGPKVLGGATPSAVLEIDFFQGFGGGAFGDVSLLNRMRLAYSELNWGDHRLAFGQMNDLIFAQAPMSLSHIAFPLGYETGNVGWRRPGIWGYHTLPASQDMKLELAWEIGRSQWVDTGAGGGAPASGIGANTSAQPNGMSQGEASNLPAVEARVTLAYQKLLTLWVAGHWNKVDLNGVGTSGGDSIDVSALGFGGKATFAGATLAAVGFTGKNTGALIGNLVQFNLGPANADVSAFGYWVQAGYNFTKELSAWFLYGQQTPDETDAKAAAMARLKNTTMNAIVAYRDGGYGLSLEWVNFKTKTATYTGGAFTSSADQDATEFIGTATYFF